MESIRQYQWLIIAGMVCATVLIGALLLRPGTEPYTAEQKCEAAGGHWMPPLGSSGNFFCYTP